jgi:hypothetical protein
MVKEIFIFLIYFFKAFLREDKSTPTELMFQDVLANDTKQMHCIRKLHLPVS